LADPLVDLQLFSNRTFNASLATNVFAIFIAIGYFLFVAQYLQLVLGLSPFEAGMWSIPSAVGFVVGSTLAPRFIHRLRPSLVIGGCLALGALGLLTLSQVGVRGELPLVVASSVIIALGLAPVFNLTTELIVGSAPPEKAGLASGISETGAELGGALGLAVLGSLGTAVYRSQVAARIPDGLSQQVRDVAIDTLGGATSIASQLRADVGSALTRTAQDAFTQGLRLVAGVSAVLAFVLAGTSAFLLRRTAGIAQEVSPSIDGEHGGAGQTPTH
jgi:DHA2 family multidrug resistance protein-like MFS transporter